LGRQWLVAGWIPGDVAGIPRLTPFAFAIGVEKAVRIVPAVERIPAAPVESLHGERRLR
jgi:hypothetical protein